MFGRANFFLQKSAVPFRFLVRRGPFLQYGDEGDRVQRKTILYALKPISDERGCVFLRGVCQIQPMTDIQKFDEAALVLIGEGSRRRCYRIPGQPFCVKFYRLPSEYTHKTTWGVRLHIWLSRFIARRNANCQEWRYHQALRGRLPPELFAAFPEVIEPVYSRVRGWGIIESLILNADGSPIKRVIAEMGRVPDVRLRRSLYAAAERLFAQLAEHAVCFYDPPNVMVQWTGPDAFRLRIVDFEPQGRALVPGLSAVRPYVRRKVRRRCARYLKRLRETYSIAACDGAGCAATQG